MLIPLINIHMHSQKTTALQQQPQKHLILYPNIIQENPHQHQHMLVFLVVNNALHSYLTLNVNLLIWES